jgi:hypothetical protein
LGNAPEFNMTRPVVLAGGKRRFCLLERRADAHRRNDDGKVDHISTDDEVYGILSA